MKTFLNRLLIIVLSPLLVLAEIIRGLYKVFTKEIPKTFKDLWKSSSIEPKTIEQKKEELLNSLHSR